MDIRLCQLAEKIIDAKEDVTMYFHAEKEGGKLVTLTATRSSPPNTLSMHDEGAGPAIDPLEPVKQLRGKL